MCHLYMNDIPCFRELQIRTLNFRRNHSTMFHSKIMKENAVVCVNLGICHEIERHSHMNDAAVNVLS